MSELLKLLDATSADRQRPRPRDINNIPTQTQTQTQNQTHTQTQYIFRHKSKYIMILTPVQLVHAFVCYPPPKMLWIPVDEVTALVRGTEG